MTDAVAFIKDNLNPDERYIFGSIKAFHNSFYSIPILLDAIEKNPKQTMKYIEQAEKNLDKLLFVPSVITGAILNRIRKVSGDNMEMCSRLQTLLTKAENGIDVTDSYWDLNRLIYGRHFDKMLASFSGVTTLTAVPHGEDLEQLSKDDFEQVYNEVTNNVCLHRRFGNCKAIDFNLKIQPGNGFAQWQDGHHTGKSESELIIFDNPNTRKENDLFYSIIHETYPGRAHFYNSVGLDSPIKIFDHGATALIGGWSTYVEWNSYKTPYTRATRHNALFLLNQSLTPNRANILYDAIIEEGYDRDEALRKVIYSTQYIGFVESYYLGALYFEQIFDIKKSISPKSYLSLISDKNCGDFFPLWV